MSRGEREKKQQHSDHQGAPVPFTMCSNHRRGGEGKSKCTTTADRASKRLTKNHISGTILKSHQNRLACEESWGQRRQLPFGRVGNGSNERSGASKSNTPPVLIFIQDVALFSKYLVLK